MITTHRERHYTVRERKREKTNIHKPKIMHTVKYTCYNSKGSTIYLSTTKTDSRASNFFLSPHRWIVPSTLAHRIKQLLPVNIGLFLKPEALNISLFIR